MIMNKAFISVPMHDKTPADITRMIEEAVLFLETKGYIGISPYFVSPKKKPVPSEVEHKRIYRLAQSIRILSKCSVIYMCSGWEEAAGCRAEHTIAKLYGVPVIYSADR